MKRLLLNAIDVYQRYLSPYKGYSCAYRVHVGGMGCSGYGRRVIARFGVRKGLSLLQRRLDACSQVYRTYQRPVNREAGHCDVFESPLCDAAECIAEAWLDRKERRRCSPCFSMPSEPPRRRRERDSATGRR